MKLTNLFSIINLIADLSILLLHLLAGHRHCLLQHAFLLQLIQACQQLLVCGGLQVGLGGLDWSG